MDLTTRRRKLNEYYHNFMTQEELQNLRAKYGIAKPQNQASSKLDIGSLRAKYGAKEVKAAETPPQTKKNLLENYKEGFTGAFNLAEKGLEKAKDFLYPSSAKTVGTTIAAPVLTLKGEKEKAAELVRQNIKPANIAFTALELLPGGGQLTKYLKKLPGSEKAAELITKTIPSALKESATQNYLRVLNPTTQKTKAIASKIAPKLAEKKVTANTLKGLENKAVAVMRLAGQKMDDVLAALPPETKTKVSPLISELEKAKTPHIVNGVIVNKQAVGAIEDMQRLLVDQLKATNGQVSTASVRRIRQILDGMVDKAGGFIPDRAAKYGTEAEKELADSIRNVLAKQVPGLEEVNAEYSFWKGTKDVVKARLKRDTGKGSGLTENMATTGGAVAGLASGGLSKAAGYALAAKSLTKLFRSTFWNTKVSAANKTRLANLLASGKVSEAGYIAARLYDGLTNQSKN